MRRLLSHGILCGVVFLMPGVLQAAAGDLDPTFGSGGKVVGDFGGTDSAQDVALQPDGKIVIAGKIGDTSGAVDFGVARYNADGSLDTTFGGGTGGVTTDFDGQNDEARALALQPDGKILVAGDAYVGPGPSSEIDFALARYNSDGTLDTTFGGGTGKVTTDFSALDHAHDLVIQPDGRIVIVGQASPGGIVFAVARYQPDGTLDATFGAGTGKVTTDVTGGGFDVAYAVALQSDGKILAAGDVQAPGPGTSEELAVVRYNADGTLDAGFGSGGKVRTDVTPESDQAHGIVVQPDGKILIAGFAFRDFVVARYLSDGSPDPTFGGGSGRVTTDFGAAFLGDRAWDIALRPDGKILAAGNGAGPGGEIDFALARYNSDGSPDPTFGGGLGRVTTDFNLSSDRSDDTIEAIALQPDGRVVAAGGAVFITGMSATFDVALARYLGECGNDVVDSGEQCDDGNVVGGDCCSSSCQFEANGLVCDDGNRCTVGDRCLSGVCTGGPGSDTDGDGDCDSEEAACRCNPNDAREICVLPNRLVGLFGSRAGEILMSWHTPTERRVEIASDPSCAPAGVCSAGRCTRGKIRDACVSDAQCDLPPNTCRAIINWADTADLALTFARIRGDTLSTFAPSTPGCSLKVDIPLDPARRVSNLRLRATGTIDEQPRIDRDTIQYRR
jgi:uncharacterized delta-60 repeat protein